MPNTESSKKLSKILLTTNEKKKDIKDMGDRENRCMQRERVAVNLHYAGSIVLLAQAARSIPRACVLTIHGCASSLSMERRSFGSF